MHTLSTRMLVALAYDRGEEYDPGQPPCAALLDDLELAELAGAVIGGEGEYERRASVGASAPSWPGSRTGSRPRTCSPRRGSAPASGWSDGHRCGEARARWIIAPEPAQTYFCGCGEASEPDTAIKESCAGWRTPGTARAPGHRARLIATGIRATPARLARVPHAAIDRCRQRSSPATSRAEWPSCSHLRSWTCPACRGARYRHSRTPLWRFHADNHDPRGRRGPCRASSSRTTRPPTATR